MTRALLISLWEASPDADDRRSLPQSFCSRVDFDSKIAASRGVPAPARGHVSATPHAPRPPCGVGATDVEKPASPGRFFAAAGGQRTDRREAFALMFDRLDHRLFDSRLTRTRLPLKRRLWGEALADRGRGGTSWELEGTSPRLFMRTHGPHCSRPLRGRPPTSPAASRPSRAAIATAAPLDKFGRPSQNLLTDRTSPLIRKYCSGDAVSMRAPPAIFAPETSGFSLLRSDLMSVRSAAAKRFAMLVA